MHKLFFTLGVLLLTILPSTTRAETVSVGFTGKLRTSPPKPIVGAKVRIYSTLSNQSSFDLVGKIQVFQEEKPVGELTVTLPAQATQRYWFDSTLTSTTNQISETLTDFQKTVPGQPLEPITLPTSSLNIKESIIAAPQPSASTSQTPTSSTSSVTIITVTSPNTSSSSTSASSSTTSSALTTVLNSALAKTATDKTKNIVETITAPLVNFLNDKQRSLEQKLTAASSSAPLPALDKAATELENKATFLKIPRDRLPGTTRIYIWLIQAAKYILSTWWIMLIILLLVLRMIWKLWRKLRTEEGYS